MNVTKLTDQQLINLALKQIDKTATCCKEVYEEIEERDLCEAIVDISEALEIYGYEYYDACLALFS